MNENKTTNNTMTLDVDSISYLDGENLSNVDHVYSEKLVVEMLINLANTIGKENAKKCILTNVCMFISGCLGAITMFGIIEKIKHTNLKLQIKKASKK